jgi:hypothetical protein
MSEKIHLSLVVCGHVDAGKLRESERREGSNKFDGSFHPKSPFGVFSYAEWLSCD